MTEPTTAAGRALHTANHRPGEPANYHGLCDVEAILAIEAEARAAGYRDGLADGSDAGRVASVYEWLGPCCTHPTPGCIECGFQPEAPAIDALRAKP